MATFGEKMHALIQERGISQRSLAKRLYCNQSHISKIKTGERTPSPELAKQIDAVLQANGELIALVPERREKTLHSREGDSDVERRQLLESLAVFGVAISPATRALENIHASLERTFGDSDRRRIDHWEEVTTEYGYSYITRPPEQFAQDLAVDLVGIRLIMRDIDTDSFVYKEWCRIGATLSALMAKTLSNLGHTREARHWWITAQTASDDSDDVAARLWVRGERLVRGLYEQRSPHLLIKQANEASDLENGNPCVGLATIIGGKAQALALVGATDAAETELTHLERTFDGLPPKATEDSHTVFGFGEDCLRYTETWVYANCANSGKADISAAQAAQLYPPDDRRTPTQIKLLQAFGRTKAGDLTEGIQEASQAYGNLPVAQRTILISSLAERIVDTVPSAQQNRPEVKAYREVVHGR
ncbi:hypothetical protein GCM10022254_31050 [Actinomadura meridiana]|uniref:HTH cro/C1-type domain-containing protein n=1 Tax=Actinomadura meridiana TaxID=559626 RepID=A0ABP8C1R2_9ACTN